LVITPLVKYRKITYPRIIKHGNGKPTVSSVDFPIHNSIKKSPGIFQQMLDDPIPGNSS
jgi:hypothetical protein